MGYESRVFIVEDYGNGYASIIADLHLAVIDNDLLDCLTINAKPIDFKIYGDPDSVGDSIDLTVDRYGKTCTYTTITEIKKALTKLDDTYRRHNLLKAVINQFSLDMANGLWTDKDLKVVHYGY